MIVLGAQQYMLFLLAIVFEAGCHLFHNFLDFALPVARNPDCLRRCWIGLYRSDFFWRDLWGVLSGFQFFGDEVSDLAAGLLCDLIIELSLLFLLLYYFEVHFSSRLRRTMREVVRPMREVARPMRQAMRPMREVVRPLRQKLVERTEKKVEDSEGRISGGPLGHLF